MRCSSTAAVGRGQSLIVWAIAEGRACGRLGPVTSVLVGRGITRRVVTADHCLVLARSR